MPAPSRTAYFEAMAAAHEVQAACHHMFGIAAALDPDDNNRKATVEHCTLLESGARDIAASYRRMARTAASAATAFSESTR